MRFNKATPQGYREEANHSPGKRSSNEKSYAKTGFFTSTMPNSRARLTDGVNFDDGNDAHSQAMTVKADEGSTTNKQRARYNQNRSQGRKKSP